MAITGGVYVDSDTGLESMSSAEAGAANNREAIIPPRDADQLRQEVCRLKNDKLDLLKQNIVSTTHIHSHFLYKVTICFGNRIKYLYSYK